jgi:hypothetical protein
MSPIGTGWPNSSWQTVVDHILGVAPGDHGSNACFVVEAAGLAGTLSAALEFVPVGGGPVAAGCCEHATEMARSIATTESFLIGFPSRTPARFRPPAATSPPLKLSKPLAYFPLSSDILQDDRKLWVVPTGP